MGIFSEPGRGYYLKFERENRVSLIIKKNGAPEEGLVRNKKV